MRRVIKITRTVAAAGLGLLAVTGCGTPVRGQPRPPSPSGSRSASQASSAGTAAASVRPVSAAATAGGACGGSVTIVPPSAAGLPALDTLAFASAARGWTAGPGRILGTSDGGATWRPEYSGPARLYQVDFADARHGWAVGASALLATSDGGARWHALPEPCGLVDSVHFVTGRLGYAVAGAHQVLLSAGTPVATASSAGGGASTAGGGRLLVTRDGGRTWYPLPGAPAQVQSACFTSPSRGYAGTPSEVWRTTDAGAHWSPALTESPAPGMPPDSTGLQCAGPAAWAQFLGAGAAMGRDPYLVYASPAGRGWHLVFGEPRTESVLRPGLRVPPGPGSYPGPLGLAGPGAAAYAGWNPAAGHGTVALDLVSGGTRVTPAGRVPGLAQPYAAAFASAARGWILGAAAARPGRVALVGTADGARTWTRPRTFPAGA